MEDAVIEYGDTDSVLPPLEQGTVRKVTSSNALLENRFRIYRNQLQKEQNEAKMRFLGKRQDFLRTSIVLQEGKRLASRKKSNLRSMSDIDKKDLTMTVEEKPSLVHTLSKEDLTARENGTRSTRENSSNFENKSPLGPSFFLPPLHKNIIIDLKDAKERKEKQEMYWRLNKIKLEDLQSCRYLRISDRAKLISDENRIDKQTTSYLS